ncbi:MAG: L-lysine 6-transaminase [Polyangiaceae bacterium]
MTRHAAIAPKDVHSTLARHMLVDGYPMVVDLVASRPQWVRDAVTGHDYLDFFSFFASNPLGINHPKLMDEATKHRLLEASINKVSNPDCYTAFFAEFVDVLGRTAGAPELPHYFFIDGGGLAVENAMKTAFDWKVRKNMAAGRGQLGTRILHFEHAFHGRTGYTLSVTNTDPVKTDYFPKFDWPRVPAPALRFPLDAAATAEVGEAEARSLAAIEAAFDRHPHDIAAILIEPIQAEGGDNHFRPELFRALRKIADEREAMLIFDEVQTGLGITGKWWAWQHHGVAPDAMCFAKKMHVGGIMVGRRVEEVADHVFAKPSRINSTFGANLVDMVRCTRVLEVIVEDNLLDNVTARGAELLAGLQGLAQRHPQTLSNPRGQGVMCAIDVRDRATRSAILERCYEAKMIVLPCGTRSIRFRPTLTVGADLVAEGLSRFERAVTGVEA